MSWRQENSSSLMLSRLHNLASLAFPLELVCHASEPQTIGIVAFVPYLSLSLSACPGLRMLCVLDLSWAWWVCWRKTLSYISYNTHHINVFKSCFTDTNSCDYSPCLLYVECLFHTAAARGAVIDYEDNCFLSTAMRRLTTQIQGLVIIHAKTNIYCLDINFLINFYHW